MTKSFNVLELAIFEWLKSTYANPLLTAQIKSAKFQKRDWTKVGFYIFFEVSKELAPISLVDFSQSWPISGPDLISDDIEHDGASILWGGDGYINCLEMFAHGSYFNQTVEKFKLLPAPPNF